MGRARNCAVRPVLIVSVLAFAAACTVKSTKLFEGSPATETGEWRTGDELWIQSPNGSIVVDTADEERISATVNPFVLLAHDATDEEARDELEKLNLSVGWEELADGGTRISVDLDREGKVSSSLGGDLAVTIPEAFDGALRISHENGPTEIKDPGDAVYVEVASENGSCDLNLGAPRGVDVECGNGSLEATVSGVPDSFGGGRIRTGNGDIEIAFPSNGTYQVIAESKGGGTVDVGNAASVDCIAHVDGAVTAVRCNGATSESPAYSVTTLGSLAHEITLRFR